LKVVISTRNFIYPLGGFEEHIYQLLKGFRKKKVECEVLTTTLYSENMNYHEESCEGATIKRFPIDHTWLGYCYSKRLSEALTDVECDLIHAQGWRNHAVRAAINIACRRNKASVLTPHGLYHPGRYSIIKSLYNTLFGKRVIKRTTVIALTNHQVETYHKMGAKKVSVIPNGIDFETFSAKPKTSVFESMNIKSKKTILCVGRIAWYKGFQDIINALPTILAKNPDVCFIIVGEDWGAMDRLKALAKKNGVSESVFFTGFLSKKKLISAYHEADLFISSAAYEGFGINILEAMAAGNPVIATKTGVALDLEDAVLTYEYGNSEKLGQLIDRVLSDEEVAKEIGQKSAEIASNFSWDKVINQLLLLYKEMID
jgi:glycosyltransferase involved in cell wall biosynthesis